MTGLGKNFELKGKKIIFEHPHRWKLRQHPLMRRGKRVMIIILDGWGEQIDDEFNGIHVAATPTMDELKRLHRTDGGCFERMAFQLAFPAGKTWETVRLATTLLVLDVYLPKGLVDVALSSGKLYDGAGFKYISAAFDKNTVHFMGLLSDGGVHSRSDQLSLLMKGCAERGCKRICVHILLDGRDVAPESASKYIGILEKDLADVRNMGCDAMIASGGGRMAVTMDRYENDWGVVKKGWDAQVRGEAPHKFASAMDALEKLKGADPKLDDQYFPPFVVVGSDGKPVGPILDDDAVVSFNFRADRMVMAAKAFDLEKFDKFDRGKMPRIKYAGMLQYDADLDLPKHFLVAPPLIEKTSGEYLVHNYVKTWACSETVKFGHVTFVWNGNRSGMFSSSLEKYVEIPSDKGIAFNEKPEMKAIAIAEKAAAALLSGKFNHVRVNIANGDMVGHTGDPKATVIGCETVDKAVKIMLDAVEQVKGIFLITADHGNAEDMVKRNLINGKPVLSKKGETEVLTSHTCNPVPCIIGGPGLAKGVRFRKDLPDAGLANVASTFINFHGFHAPWNYEPTLVEYDEPENKKH